METIDQFPISKPGESNDDFRAEIKEKGSVSPSAYFPINLLSHRFTDRTQPHREGQPDGYPFAAGESFGADDNSPPKFSCPIAPKADGHPHFAPQMGAIPEFQEIPAVSSRQKIIFLIIGLKYFQSIAHIVGSVLTEIDMNAGLGEITGVGG